MTGGRTTGGRGLGHGDLAPSFFGAGGVSAGPLLGKVHLLTNSALATSRTLATSLNGAACAGAPAAASPVRIAKIVSNRRSMSRAR